jgi:hypothetical protein
MENDNIYSALAKAQATYSVAHKSGYNPHYKSYFSTFEDLVLASRESLTREGLSITQYVETEYDKEYLWTNLMHYTKEHIASKVQIHVKDKTDIQKFGSAITYLKRYMYASICGIATSEHDEDSNDVVDEPVISDKQVGLLRALIKDNKILEDTICKHYNVQSLNQIPAGNMNQILDKLKSRN